MSCIGVKVDKISCGIGIMASLACQPLSAAVSTAHSDMNVKVHVEDASMKFKVDLSCTPIDIRVSQVCSLGKVDDTHELFYLADGGVFLLYDGKTFMVVDENGRIRE
jgi:hypothetical protein